jgi:hypothetical protein
VKPLQIAHEVVPQTVEEVVTAFAAKYVECEYPEHIADRCFAYSAEFAAWAQRAGHDDVEVVSGVHFDGENRIILAGHAATRVGDTVYDWTLRQFYPDAAVPTITPYATWRDDWKPLKEEA